MAAPKPIPCENLREFLEKVPPGTEGLVASGAEWIEGNVYPKINLEPIKLYCADPDCEKLTSHDPGSGYGSFEARCGGIAPFQDVFISYICRHCKRTGRMYSIRVSVKPKPQKGFGEVDLFARKYGENPRFGPPTPAKLRRLIGTDFHLYEKGRQAETQGLGIAAFAYYRRVVENQKNALIGEIKRVAEYLDAPAEMIADLDRARSEISFEKSVMAIKGGIPNALLLKGGHNPLQLLHTALSKGVHEDDDAACLELAGDIRAVLADLSERTQKAMEETAELSAAVSRLLAKTATGKIKPNANPPTVS